jgi:fumarylacetoacetase
VTLEALEPYRWPVFPRAPEDPQPLPYLFSEKDRGYDITLEMHLRPQGAREAVRLSRSSFRDAYWTPAQMVAHQSSNGCNLRPGDLLGSGTISGSTPGSAGSLMELTQAGKVPIELLGHATRSFLEDGDEVIERGRCAREGYAAIGFGEAAGRIIAARAA